MKLDEALKLLGAYGRYQLFVFVAISIFDNFPSIMHMSIMTFIGYEPQHRCQLPNSTVSASLVTAEKCFVVWNQTADHQHTLATLNHSATLQRLPCPRGWSYDRTPIETSIVTDWDLVCDRNVLPEASQMIFNFGVMFGAILFGFLSDKFGRKKPFVAALVIQAVVGGLTAASPNFSVFTVLRFIVGALEQGINITGFVMATELFPPKERTIAAVSHEFFWALGGAILPVWAYLFRQWRHLQFVVSLPTVLGFILIWTIPESLVWLIAKGRISEAETILERAATVNGKQLPAHCLRAAGDADGVKISRRNSGETHPSTERTYTLLDIVRTPNLRRITFCISGLWALNTMVYYGLSLNTPNLYGDMYINFFIGQIVEIPSVIVTMWVIYRIGRRWPLCLFHVFGGLVCIASPFIPPATASGADLTWLSVSLAMLGKFAINASFTIIYIYGPEIYPTVVRNTGAGMGSFAGRFGGILYPYINYLSKTNASVGRQLPLVIFGVLSIVGGFLALPLPETRHRPLPKTIDDVEHYDEFCQRHPTRRSHRETTDDDGQVDRNRVVEDVELK